MSRVLLVEDQEQNVYYLRALLTGNGWTVETARHGAEALVMARRNPPDLVVSDLLMPVMDGYTLLRHWKADERLRHAPFVVYTATYTAPEDEALALQLGADAFILKPAEPEAFVARVREVQSRPRPASPAATDAPPGVRDPLLLQAYSEALIRKLEEKTLGLEQANRQLAAELEERRQAAAMIMEQATLLDQAADAIVVCTLEGRVRYWNKAAERLFGTPPAEAQGRLVQELIAPGSEHAAAWRTALEHGDWSGELQHRCASGHAIVVATRWSLLRDDQGAPKSLLSIHTDITEKKAIESRFLRAQRLESIGTLAGGIAHDLNNMLAPILMGVSLLRNAVREPEPLQILEIVERSAMRGTNLVKQVLLFARGADEVRAVVNLDSLIREFATMARTTFPKDIEVVVEVHEKLWPVLGDPTRLHQALLNLGVNARDAMPQGGRLRIAARNAKIDRQFAVMSGAAAPGSYVVITVADTGGGITAETQQRIFEPFFTTKGDSGGTGLGLSTTREIIRGHKGFIDLQSAASQGTTFEIYLPRHVEDPGGSGSPFIAADLLRGHGELILVVDDESSIRDIMRQTLESFGYRALTAEDGAQAIALFALNRADIAAVLTDMMMPVMDGFGLSAALRRLDPAVRIVAVTGLDSNIDPERLQRAGIVHVLSKPFTAEAMLRLLSQALAG